MGDITKAWIAKTIEAVIATWIEAYLAMWATFNRSFEAITDSNSLKVATSAALFALLSKILSRLRGDPNSGTWTA